jgi:excisionase family DNA binding protein
MEKDYSYRETAELLGISQRTLLRRKDAKLIGFYRDGARVTFGRHHIEAYRKLRERKAENA